MKKISLFIITTIMLYIAAPSPILKARRRHHRRHNHGHSGAGLAAGLIGGAMLTGIAAQSGNGRASAAEQEAREARREAQAIRREQQKEKIYGIERKMERQYMTQSAGGTLNMLILAIALLFLGLIGLAVMAFKGKKKKRKP